MKYLITGGAGYKGVKIAEALLGAGEKVTILDNFQFGFGSILHLVQNPKLTVVKHDIRDEMSGLLSKHDVIIHLAGLSGFPACATSPTVAAQVNVSAAVRLVRQLSRDQKLIFASTTAMYEVTGEGEVNEEIPLRPVGVYTSGKREAELLCLSEHADTVVLRIATVMGVSPRMRSNLLVNDFVNQAVNGGTLVLYMAGAKRTFIHIDDCVTGYLFAVARQEMSGGIWNIGSERLNYSKLEIAEAIKAQTGCEVIISLKPDKDLRNFNVSFAKVRALGFECRKTLEETIAELVKLYRFYRPEGQGC
jgi:nucleoside-diphosphate-sugar epimerase